MSKLLISAIRSNIAAVMNITVISESGETTGDVTFELHESVVPKTVKNFIELATRSQGRSYSNCPFHKIVTGKMARGGDIVSQNGEGSISIYGDFFEDESFDIPHDSRGVLSMANFGEPHTNGCQFMITFAPVPEFDDHNVAFGTLLKDPKNILKALEEVSTPEGGVNGFAVINSITIELRS